jgi:hypothetical protein
VQQLAGEVSDARALKHLQAVQKIADEHGRNRATGTPGYDASVEYVVDVLRDAGFKAYTPSRVAKAATRRKQDPPVRPRSRGCSPTSAGGGRARAKRRLYL